MRESDHYKGEPKDRKDYISQWIKDYFNEEDYQDLQTYKKAIRELISTPKHELKNMPREQRDLYNYIKGEANKDYLYKDTFKRIKEKQRTITTQIVENLDFAKVSKRNYYASEFAIKGYSGKKEYLLRAERFMKEGKVRYRYRNKKGQFGKVFL